MDARTWSILITLIVYIVGSLLILFSLLRGIFSVGKWLWKLKPKNTDLFGDDTKTSLLGLAVSALLFPKAVTTMINIPIRFCYLFFVTAPWQLVQNLQREISVCRGPVTECLLQITQGFIKPWTDAIYNFLGRVSPTNTDYRQIIYFFAIWALFTFLFDLPNKIKDPTRPRNNPQSVFDPAKSNLLFYIILILAVYFSATALITIPILQESAPVPENKSAQKLEESLTAMHDRWNKEFSTNNKPVDHFSSLESELSQPDPPKALAADVANLKSAQQGMYDRLAEQLNIVNSQLEEEKSKAINEYSTGIESKKGLSETIKHYSNIEAWYRILLTSKKKDIRECSSDIASAEAALREFIKNSLVPIRPSENPPTDIVQSMTSGLESVCRYSENEFQQPPARPELGSDLGPFSNIASWLLRTESVPLSQLVGMLGFGLLGAAASSLVRRNSQNTKKEDARTKKPIVDDLAFFIIRGTTATLVVFLAVKGGTAIFVTNGSELNSYALLLTCFVAAVFSEVVWKWAQEWIQDLLKKRQDAKSSNGGASNNATTMQHTKAKKAETGIKTKQKRKINIANIKAK